MDRLLARYRTLYGSHPLHLLTMLAGFALAGYVVTVFGPGALWNSRVWWQSIAVWFAAAIVLHDFVLFPVYALADRLLTLSAGRVGAAGAASANGAAGAIGAFRAPGALNYIRIPALASGLLFLVFLPGIIRQGAPTYLAATGQTQDPFLGRWLLLTAVMFGASAAGYAFAHRDRLTRRGPGKPPPAPRSDERA